MAHPVGQLLLNRKLGLGKVPDVKGDIVTLSFKDQTDIPRQIDISKVPNHRRRRSAVAMPANNTSPTLLGSGTTMRTPVEYR